MAAGVGPRLTGGASSSLLGLWTWPPGADRCAVLTRPCGPRLPCAGLPSSPVVAAQAGGQAWWRGLEVSAAAASGNNSRLRPVVGWRSEAWKLLGLAHPTFFLLPRCGFHHHQPFPGLSPVSASSALTRQGGVGVGGGALLLDELSPSAVYSSEALFHQTMHDTTLSHCLRVVCREAAGVALEMPGWRPAALTVSSYCSYCCTQPQLLTVLPQGDCQLLARLSVERGGGQAARGVGEEALSSLAK